MYNQSSPASIKPSAVRRNPSSLSSGGSSFLHGGNKLNNTPSWVHGNKNDTTASSITPKKSWETKAQAQKPWETKPPENELTSAFNRFGNSATTARTNEQNHNKPSPKPSGFSSNSGFGNNRTQNYTLVANPKNETESNPLRGGTKPIGSSFPAVPAKPSWGNSLPNSKKFDQSGKANASVTIQSEKASLPTVRAKPSFNKFAEAQKSEVQTEKTSFKKTSNIFQDKAGPINDQQQKTAFENSSQKFTPIEAKDDIRNGTQPEVDRSNQTVTRAGGNEITRGKNKSFLFQNAKPKAEETSAPLPPTTPQIVVDNSKQRRKRQLPSDVYHKPPPEKPRKPLHAKLPNQDNLPTSTPKRNSSFLGGKNRGSSPNLNADISPTFPAPPSPMKLRNLPAPPPVQSDDVYDDACETPVPIDSRSTCGTPVEEIADIPTWEDEEEFEDCEALYDQTPDDLQSGAIGGGQEMYEAPEHYKRFGNQPGMLSEKKRKELEKKERSQRKEFKLPLEGELPVECSARTKGDFKNKHLNVHAHEKVDVLRKVNAKGKSNQWLIRTENGTYGYIDSDNLNVYESRGPPLPPTSNLPYGAPPLPPPSRIKPQEEDPEAIYDEACQEDGEDLYEEFS